MNNIKSLQEFILESLNESKEIELTFDSRTGRKLELEEFKSQINNIDKSIKVDINWAHNSILIRTNPKFVDSIKKLSKSFEVDDVSESFHMPDGTPIGVDHLHRPITGTYPPSSLDESKIGDIYIMAAEAPNFPAFKKEFIKEYGEVKGSKEEKDLNDWLKNVWDERPTI